MTDRRLATQAVHYFGQTDKKRNAELRKMGLTYVTGMQENSGYEWQTIDVFRDTKSKALLYVIDSGCSCYGPGDTPIDPIYIDTYRTFRDEVNRVSWADHATTAAFLARVRRAMPK
jgi:hypothetical protein